MPFCQNCGYQITEDSKFCEKCGAAQQIVQSHPQINVQPVFSNQNNTPSILFSSESSNKKFNLNLTYIILIFILCFFVVYFINIEISELVEYDHLEEIAFKIKGLKRFRAIFIFFASLCELNFTLKCSQIKQNYIKISQDGVYGGATPAFGFGTQKFHLAYTEIRNVFSVGDTLTINAQNKKYTCFIDDAQKARFIIQSFLNNIVSPVK